MLLTAVIAACAVGTTVQAGTGWGADKSGATGTLYVNGTADSQGALNQSGMTITTETPEGGVFTTYIDATTSGTREEFIVAADGADNVGVNAEIGTLTIGNGSTMKVAESGWGTGRYFDQLTINQLTVADSGSANLTVSGPAHIVNIKGLSGSLENVKASSGLLTISAASASVSGMLYSDGGNVTLGDGTNAGIITVNRVEFSDKNGGSELSLNIESGYTLKVTGTTNTIQNDVTQYKNNSFIVSEWANSTVMNVKGTVLAEGAAVLTGDSGVTINVENGGVLAAKGLGRSNPGKTSTSVINLKEGGKLVLGSMGLDYDGYVTVNVSGGTIGIADNAVTIAEGMNVTGSVTVDTTQYAYGDNGLEQGSTGGNLTMNGDLTGGGTLNLTGAGKVMFGAISSDANISAGATNVSFGGTLALGDSATFTAGTGSYKIAANDLSLYTVDPEGGIVDKDGVTAVNGFKNGAYVLIDGGTIENEFTVSYDGQDYTINNDNRTFGVGGIGFGTWYVNEGSSTLSEVYAQSQAGAQVDAAVSLAGGTTLNVDTTLNTGVEMTGDATFNISEGQTVVAGNVKTNDHTVTLDGKGTYNIASGAATKVAVADGWSGLVELFGQSNGTLALENFGKAGSTISIKEYVGYFALGASEVADIAANIVLTNTNLAAVELTNGYSDGKYNFTGSVSGDGNFLVNTETGKGNNMTFTFSGDVSGWSGQLAAVTNTQNFTFTGDATVINAQLISRNAGRANITFDHQKDVTVNSNFTNDANGIYVTVKNTGTTTFTSGQVAMKSLTLESGTAAFTGVDALTVTDLTLAAGTKVSVGTGVAVAAEGAAPALAVTGAATLAGGSEVEGGLDLSSATSVTLNGMDAAVTITGDLTLPGTAISLSGDVLTALTGLTAGGKLDLFDVSGVFTLGDAAIASLTAEDNTLLNTVFTATEITEDYYLGYENGVVYAGKFDAVVPPTPVDPTVPEPTTATLSLLALAALAARRRRR